MASRPLPPPVVPPVRPRGGGGTRGTAPARAGRPARMPRPARELQMLEVAEAVFAERGYQAASMDEIAERVGVSKPMLYEYFGSKDGLLLAAIARLRAELRAVVEAAVAGGGTARDVHWRGLVAFFEWVDRHAAGYSLLLNEGSAAGGQIFEAIEVARAQQSDLIVGILTAGSDPGRIPERLRLEGWAQAVVGACERVALWRRGHPEVTARMAAQYVMELTWSGLGGLSKEPDPAAP